MKMEESKFKTIIDKILIGIFIFLCLMGFILVVCELPNFLNELFNITTFENVEILSFFACIALLGYVIKFYEDKNSYEKNKISMKHVKEISGLDNYWKLHDYKTFFIKKIEKTEFYKIRIITINEYSIDIPMELFSKISKPNDLMNLDMYISTLIKDSADKQKENFAMKLTEEIGLTKKIEDYLKQYESK